MADSGVTIDSLQVQIEATAGNAEKSLDALKKSLETLQSALKGGTGLSAVVKDMKELDNQTKTLGTSSAQNIEKLVQALRDLQGVGKLNLTTTSKELENVAESSKKVANTSAGFGKKLLITYASLRGIGHMIASLIDKSNTYVEDLNLFNASLGKYATTAQEYAEQVSELMGIDPAKWMRNQGIFQTLAQGFGVAGDRAIIMSKNLTQLGYDLSSFFNIAVEGEGGAMQKLQAAISGELEPLRRLGFDLSEARLKAVALSLGIDQTFNSMTQAQKAQLRYYAIMTQVTTAQGDMARTLETPANQLRIFKAQVEQAARALGNIFIPALNAVLPIAIAVTEAIRMVAQAIAEFLGFTLPEVDYSGLEGATGAADDLDNSLKSAGGSAKKLKDLLADWDELNIIQSESGGGSGSGGKGVMNPDDWKWDLPEYDFIKDLTQTRVGEILESWKPTIDWIKEHMEDIWTAAKGILATVGIWKIATMFVPGLKEASGFMADIVAAAATIALSYATVQLEIGFTTKWLDTGDYGQLLGSTLTSIAGSSLLATIIRHIITGEKGAILANVAAGTLLTVTGMVDIVLGLNDIETKGFNYRNIVSLLKGSLTSSAGMAIIARGLGKAITGRTATMGEMLGMTATAFVFTVGASMNIALNKSVLEGDPVALAEQAGVSLAEALGVGVSLALTTGSTQIGAAAGALAFSANAVVNFVTALGNVSKNGVTKENTLALIANSLGATTGIGALVGILTGSVGWALVGGALTFGVAAAAYVIVKELTINADKSLVPKWGTRSLTADEVKATVDSWFGFDVDAEIKSINAVVSANANYNVDTKNAATELGKKITAWLMDLNDEESLAKIHLDLFGDTEEGGELDPNSLLGKLKKELDAGRAQVQSWFTSYGGAGTENTKGLLDLMNLSDNMIMEGVEAVGKQWGELFAKGFTDETKDLGIKLLELIANVASAGELGSLQAEYEMSILDFSLGDLDEDSMERLISDFAAKQQGLLDALLLQEDETTKKLKSQIEQQKAYIAGMRELYGDDYDLKEYEDVLARLEAQYGQRMSNRGAEAQAKWNVLTATGREMFAQALYEQLGAAEWQALQDYVGKNYPELSDLFLGYKGEVPFELNEPVKPEDIPTEDIKPPMLDWMYDTTVYDEFSDKVEGAADALYDLGDAAKGMNSVDVDELERIRSTLMMAPERVPSTSFDYRPELDSLYNLLEDYQARAFEAYDAGDVENYRKLVDILNTGYKAYDAYANADWTDGQKQLGLLKDLLSEYSGLGETIFLDIDATNAVGSLSTLETKWDELIEKMRKNPVGMYFPHIAGSDEVDLDNAGGGGSPAVDRRFVSKAVSAGIVGHITTSSYIPDNEQNERNVASGVREGNDEQNALLREQNTILRGILAKTGVVTPSTALARTVQRSNEMLAGIDGAVAAFAAGL